jgi:hypothetical protein
VRKPPVPIKALRNLAEELTDACIAACLVEGTAGEAVGRLWMDGDYSVGYDGQLELHAGAETNVPTDPVEGNARIGWLKKRKRYGTGNLQVELRVKVKTLP